MADYASPAPSEGANEPKKITFRFCADCSNLLYPRENPENRNSLQFACRTCNYYTDADTSCIYRNEMSNTAAETAGVTSDLGQDPTVSTAAGAYTPHSNAVSPNMDVEDLDVDVMGDVPSFCTMCGQEIFCEICGQETKDAGLFIEADDDDPRHTMHASRPKEVPLGAANEYDIDEDEDADVMDHDHQELRLLEGRSHMTERNGTQQEQE